MRVLIAVVGITLIAVPGGAAPIIWELGTSARAMALGGAFSALADDESALFYNPAGLALLNTVTIAAFYHRVFEVVHHVALTGTVRNWGVQLIQIDTGSIESTNEFGNPSGELTHYASQAGLVGVGVGTESFSVGIRGKLSSEGHETHWGVDAGALVQVKYVRVGLVVENLQGNAELSVKLGGALIVPFSPRMTIAMALEAHGILDRPWFHIGLEASLNGVGLRVGYDGVAVSMGAGVRWNSLRLDWAYRMHPQLPASTMVTIAYLF